MLHMNRYDLEVFFNIGWQCKLALVQQVAAYSSVL